tara:strand:+ start:465 stop:1535 length:1071 start_codon:yes stop_codon:yes gene_type:complete
MALLLLLTLAGVIACGNGSNGPDGSHDDDDSTSDDDDSASDDDDSTSDDDDSAETELWPFCPQSSSYVGNTNWQQTLEVSSAALYCAMFNESRSLEQEPSFKAQLRLIPGSYGLPHEEGLSSMALPVCIKLAEGQGEAVMDGTGNVQTTTSGWQESTFYSHLLEQPMTDSKSSEWWLKGTLRLEATGSQSPAPLLADGSAPSAWSGTGLEFSLCPDDAQSCYEGRHFLSCNPTGYRLQRHSLQFNGGELQLDIRMGESAAATEPAAFIRAAGNLDGQDFEQTSYWKLIYNPTHHHFSRDFALLFDSPIGGACGIKAINLDPWGDAPPGQVFTVDCELSNIEERTLNEESFIELTGS